MKTILSLAVGFWIGRQIYINYDKEEARGKEANMKAKLKKFLEEHGLSKSEVKERSEEILGIG